MTTNEILDLESLNIEVLDDEVLSDIAGGCSRVMCSIACCSGGDVEF